MQRARYETAIRPFFRAPYSLYGGALTTNHRFAVSFSAAFYNLRSGVLFYFVFVFLSPLPPPFALGKNPPVRRLRSLNRLFYMKLCR